MKFILDQLKKFPSLFPKQNSFSIADLPLAILTIGK